MRERGASPIGPVRSRRKKLEGGDADRCWTIATLAFGLACAAVFLARALAAPSDAIADDARQFLAWTGRLADPSLLPGDLLADYWFSVTPWFYRALFEAASGLGIGPVGFAKLLPALLLPLAALFAFRFERAVGFAPFVAFLAAAGFVVYVARAGTIGSATPRSLWPVLLPALLDGLARRSVLRSALAQLLLAGSYPQLTLVTATLIGLTLADGARPGRLDLSRRRLALVGACAAATVVGILPFLAHTGAFDPVATLAEARHLPFFGPGGRNEVLEADGSLDFFCGSRLGLFPKLCRGGTDARFWLLALLTFAGPAVLFARRLRGASGPRSELPLLLFFASLLWFALSAALMFRLHLPSRYATALVPLAILATLPLLLERLASLPRGGGRPRAWLGTCGLVAGLLFALAGALSMPARLRVPEDAGFVAFLRTLPRDAVVAGFADDLDFSPVLTGRSTLFSRELAIGYQLGYIRPVLGRMADMRDAILTPDPAVLAERLARNQVDVLVVEAGTLGARAVPASFRGFFDAGELDRAEAGARATGPSALSGLAPACVRARFDTVTALDAACLEVRARAAR